jgi:leader peptidase (prepilin peptidase)/N-methyltransferase
MPLLGWFVVAFVVGAWVGALINRCVDRLPYERSLWWPGARCPVTFQSIRWYDQIPILSYLMLGGRYRASQSPIPVARFAVELGTSLAFVGLLFWVAVYEREQMARMQMGRSDLASVWIAAHYAVLFSFLLTASLCDLREMEIPLTITVPGTLVGLILSTLAPWPLPGSLIGARPVPGVPDIIPPLTGSLHPWPVWYPLPTWLPPESWQLGLATGLAGALAGMLILRVVAFLFKIGRGIEGLGIGDADLMMMVGAFVGWQPVVLAFFVAVGPALLFAIVQAVSQGERPLPFGPALALGAMLTVLFWGVLGPRFALLFFDPLVLGVLGGAGAVILLVAAFVLRLRGPLHE